MHLHEIQETAFCFILNPSRCFPNSQIIIGNVSIKIWLQIPTDNGICLELQKEIKKSWKADMRWEKKSVGTSIYNTGLI